MLVANHCHVLPWSCWKLVSAGEPHLLGRLITDVLATLHCSRLEHPLLRCCDHRRLSIFSFVLHFDSFDNLPGAADLQVILED